MFLSISSYANANARTCFNLHPELSLRFLPGSEEEEEVLVRPAGGWVWRHSNRGHPPVTPEVGEPDHGGDGRLDRS